MTETIWMVNDSEYFEAPGLSVLVFHDAYPEGKQGGIEIIQHGERVATNGDLRLEPAPGQWAALPEVGRRDVDAEKREVKVALNYRGHGLAYEVSVKADGDSLRIRVDLDRPFPLELVGKVGFNLELFPPAYFGKTFHIGDAHGVFPRQGNGPIERGRDGELQVVPMGTGPRLSIAPEDPLHRMTIERIGGDIELIDGRNTAQNGWFVVRSVAPAGTTTGAIEWSVTPHAVQGWRREPVICISQVGYHPDQQKRAIIELDLRTESIGDAVLLRVDPLGGPTPAFAAPAEKWGRFLRYDYAVFDFTHVQAPGMYLIEYDGRRTPPFRIGADIYRNGAWQPTLETFIPVQMCHVNVRDQYRVWHGACHLDDALQAPPSHDHFDGYRQSPATDTSYCGHEHIPGLDRGGWHDAGDYDLVTGSQSHTTFVLSLIRETFGVDTDQTTVRRDDRLVVLHTPDGVPDIVQQVAHGVENLLSGYRVAGHSFYGIIESTIEQYVHLGDACTVTDNRVYDPSMAPEGVADERSGKMDDRWVFTGRDTAREYGVITALAAASRVLRGYEEELARECLETASSAWDREQAAKASAGEATGSEPNASAYPDVPEVVATIELLITTGYAGYREHLLGLLPIIEASITQVAWAVARAMPWVEDRDFECRIEYALRAMPVPELTGNPYGVPFEPAVWGIGWGIQHYALERYFLTRAYPELFDREDILRVVNYVLGCHPGSDVSLVSGVGARSLTVAYGTNRADWSYIPGGVASGTNLVRPDLPELKEPFPFLWQQAEYVIGGAATYIFCVLAADDLLNGRQYGERQVHRQSGGQ